MSRGRLRHGKFRGWKTKGDYSGFIYIEFCVMFQGGNEGNGGESGGRQGRSRLSRRRCTNRP
ncbi:hypothetical protein BURPS305_3019 [Burkholderia pseudomallei 305]|nr:hypothetical protein BURPS305_3019 [Burkholderia pseudomallei 305]